MTFIQDSRVYPVQKENPKSKSRASHITLLKYLRQTLLVHNFIVVLQIRINNAIIKKFPHALLKPYFECF